VAGFMRGVTALSVVFHGMGFSATRPALKRYIQRKRPGSSPFNSTTMLYAISKAKVQKQRIEKETKKMSKEG
jgi:hypothetical protein